MVRLDARHAHVGVHHGPLDHHRLVLREAEEAEEPPRPLQIADDDGDVVEALDHGGSPSCAGSPAPGRRQHSTASREMIRPTWTRRRPRTGVREYSTPVIWSSNVGWGPCFTSVVIGASRIESTLPLAESLADSSRRRAAEGP